RGRAPRRPSPPRPRVRHLQGHPLHADTARASALRARGRLPLPADQRYDLVQGVRVSGPPDLLAQLAEQLEHDDLVAAADQLVGPDARVRPRPRLEHLRDRARKARNTYRIRKVRSALVDARERVESPKETQTRLTLLRAGFAEPEINLPVRAPRS